MGWEVSRGFRAGDAAQDAGMGRNRYPAARAAKAPAIKGGAIISARSRDAAARRRFKLAAAREKLAAIVEAAIARMDEIDGDPDLEPNGDEEPSGDEHEPNQNPPVTEGTMGQPKWEPGPMPLAGSANLPDLNQAENLPLDRPGPPEGFVAIRELRQVIR